MQVFSTKIKKKVRFFFYKKNYAPLLGAYGLIIIKRFYDCSERNNDGIPILSNIFFVGIL